MKLLHIDSSILGDHSISRAVSAAIVSRLKAEIPGLEITYRDLAAAPLSHLSGAYLAGQNPTSNTTKPCRRIYRSAAQPWRSSWPATSW